MQRVRSLKPGGKIGVFAPGSPTRPERIVEGTNYLESLGYKVKIPLDPAKNYARVDGSFSSASVEERLEALTDLLQDDEVEVIIGARGAYGSAELLPKLDYGAIENSKKALVGFSDITVLVATIPQFSGLSAIHGPSFTKDIAEASISSEAASNVESLFRLLSDSSYRFSCQVLDLKAGTGEGELLAGNLTVLTTLLGTPWDVDYTDKVLVLEDTGEAPYRIHRMLMQLYLSGKLENLSALCLGNFSKCTAKFPPDIDTVFRRFVDEMLGEQDFPVVAGLPCGHEGKNVALPVGMLARVSAGKFEVLESPIEMP